MRTQNAQQTTFFSWPKMAVTISTLPEQLTTTLQKRNLPNIQMPEQFHNFNINNIKLPKVKMHYTSPVKIIPLPFAFLGRRPALRAASRLPTVESSPVPPSQMLGVLCFPLSPPSRKGATQEPEIN
jgi:hypothetical protein